MSAAMAPQSDAAPAKVRTANTAFTPDWLVHCIELSDVLPLEEDLLGPNARPNAR